MSEMEQLKAEADKQRHIQRIKAVNEYLEGLSEEIDILLVKVKRANKIYFIAWLLWLGSIFVGLQSFGLIIFFIGMGYQQWYSTDLHQAFGKYFGAIKMLELLGYIDPIERPGDKKKRKVWEKGIDLVKKWSSEKKKAQDAVYAPA